MAPRDFAQKKKTGPQVPLKNKKTRPQKGPLSNARNPRPQVHLKARVSIRQHESACFSMLQHASAYISIRQDVSAYVSIRVCFVFPHIGSSIVAEISCRRTTRVIRSIRQQASADVSIRQKSAADAQREQSTTRTPSNDVC